MNWQELAPTIITCAGVVLAAAVGGWFGHLTAKKNAESTNRDAFTRAYEAASLNWARYTDAVQKWCESQSVELSKLSERQERTDLALQAEILARHKAERLYAVAIIYLRRIASWFAEHWPGEEMPPPPPELEPDLDP